MPDLHRDRPVVVVGAAGQLGSTVAVVLARTWATIGLTRADLDLLDAKAVAERLSALRPLAIVNCAGYNEVDRAEHEPVAALEINAIAVRTLARVAESVDAVLVHYSSDFVFDGRTDRPYTEEDQPEPQSTYAASKLLGEWFAAEAPVCYVLRVESLFGGAGRRRSSLDRIIDVITAGGPARVLTDRIVSPSFAWDVAAATAALLERRPPTGLYHCVNTGSASWHDLAVEAGRQLGVEPVLEPITMADLRLPAARPQYCALANDKLRQAGIAMPPWQDALGRALSERRTTHDAERAEPRNAEP